MKAARKDPLRNYPLPLRMLHKLMPAIERMLPPLAKWLVTRFFFTPIKFRLPASEQELLAAARQYKVRSGGSQIHVNEWGKGKPVLFMHGWSSRSTQFQHIIRKMVQEGYCCVAIDAPGHGQSEGRQADLMTFGQALIDAAAPYGRAACLISHSMGGAVAIWAIQHGLRVSSLVIMSTPAIAEDIISTSCRRMNASRQMEVYLNDAIRKKMGKDFRCFTASWLAAHAKLPATLLVYDEDDPDAPPDHGRELQKLIPGAELVITSGLGHTKILKDKGVIAEMLRFLSR